MGHPALRAGREGRADVRPWRGGRQERHRRPRGRDPGALADGDPPVTIKVLVEGEEECSTEHLPELVQGHADLLRADVVVIADGGTTAPASPR